MLFKIGEEAVDSVELKCLVISRGLKIDREVYQKCGKDFRIYPNALTCNSFKLPDGTIVMATDLGFHLSTLSSMFSWDNLKLFKYMGDMTTDYRLSLVDGQPALLYKGETVTPVELFPASDFFKQKTSSGMPFMGNAVLQGCDWVAFQCLWPCDYACAGKPCQFCFSGGQFEALAKRHKPMPFIPSPQDVSEVVLYAVEHDGVNSMQLTGGSTFKAETEEEYITAYMKDMLESGAREALKGRVTALHHPSRAARRDRPLFRSGREPHRLLTRGLGRQARREHHAGQAFVYHQEAPSGRADLYRREVRPGKVLLQFHNRP